MSDTNQLQLIDEAKNGSNYALSLLLEQNYAAVYKFMVKVTLDTQFAADITQDCMVRVIEKIQLYDPEKSAFSTWMITIAKNLWIEECRRKKRRRSLCETIMPQDGVSRIDEIIEQDEILSALKKLSLKIRLPVVLRHSAGYSYEEIARILKIPVGTVKSRIFNGLKLLEKELGKSERQE